MQTPVRQHAHNSKISTLMFIRCNDLNGQHQVLDLIYIQIYKTQFLKFLINQCGPVLLSSICLPLLSSTAKANALDEILI